jgi:hypothetical protein
MGQAIQFRNSNYDNQRELNLEIELLHSFLYFVT